MNYSTYNKDNNLNLIRFVASMFVLYNHSFILSGFIFEEPLWKKYASIVTFGNLGVDIFFITSGFLLSLSLLAKRNIFIFFISRVLRIFPGLIFSLVVTVIVVGLFFTGIDFYQFINDGQTKHFLLYNSFLMKGVVYLLPGAFHDNPIKSINGSLWTLPHELKVYIAILFIALISLAVKKQFSIIFKLLISVLCIYCYFRYSQGYFGDRVNSEKYRLYFFFFFGACFGSFISNVKLDMRWAFVCLAVIFLCLPHKNLLFFAYTLLLPYVVLAIAYIPSGSIREFNKIGDYSYGIYIYGFFVQQCIVSLAESITPHMLFAYSFLVTVVVSIFSWHLIESPALRLKNIVQKQKMASYFRYDGIPK
ncbi:MAG: acyltransferase [Burkholderiaceae bacterium]|nr:acyltransferase [Burkholderiaceae bacterium]